MENTSKSTKMCNFANGAAKIGAEQSGPFSDKWLAVDPKQRLLSYHGITDTDEVVTPGGAGVGRVRSRIAGVEDSRREPIHRRPLALLDAVADLLEAVEDGAVLGPHERRVEPRLGADVELFVVAGPLLRRAGLNQRRLLILANNRYRTSYTAE